MHILRRIALAILSPLFIFLLFATALAIGFTQTAAHPEKVKKLIADSGIYSTVAPSLLKQQESISTPIGTIQTSSPEVKKAFNQAVPPSLVQQNTEAAIDSLYSWLDGKTAEPTLDFSLAGQKSNFADSLAASVEQRLTTLPACTLAQSLAIARSGSFDPINATCLPLNTTPSVAGQNFKKILMANESFLDKANVSIAGLKTEKGQSPFDKPQIKIMPTVYQWAKNSKWILLILTILTGLGMVFLSRTRRAGLRHIGINLLTVGVVMFVFTYVLRYVITNTVIPKIKIDSQALQTITGNLLSELTAQINSNYRLFGGIYILLGAAAIGTSIFLNHRNSPAPTVQPANRAKKKL